MSKPVEGKAVEQPSGSEKTGAVVDAANAFLGSLSAEQRQKVQAVLGYKVADLVLGPGEDGKKIVPEGLKVSAMSDRQKSMLLDLMGEWAGILDARYAGARMAELKAELNESWFAWSGATTAEPGSNLTAYNRIQGPHVVIEYAPQQDEPGNHVHTMYRDATNDYGSALLTR